MTFEAPGGPGMAGSLPRVGIFVACHKPAAWPDAPGYLPIHVGRAVAGVDLGLLGDDTGDNISALNPYFCELTLLYWIWKNISADVVGLVHYRRYFQARDRAVEVGGRQVAAAEDFPEIGTTHDLIVAEPTRFLIQPLGLPLSNAQQYGSCVPSLDLHALRQAVREVAPDYLDAHDFVMADASCSLCNMMLGRKAVVDAYAEWLFEILFLLERRIPYRHYPPYEARVFGFLAERLLTVWVAENRTRLSIGYRPVGMVE